MTDLEYLEKCDILVYSAAFQAFFDTDKNRVSKGKLSTVKQASLAGTWTPSTLHPNKAHYTGYMMRTGSRPKGSGFILFDFDIKGGEDVIEKFEPLFLALKDMGGVKGSTGSGGIHIYWKMPPGASWNKETNLESIEINGVEYKTHGALDIMADGGSVILPGSTYTYKGVEYKYGLGKGMRLEDAVELPAALADALNKRQSPQPKIPFQPAPAETLEIVPRLPPLPRSQTPQKVRDEELGLVVQLLECLTPEWLDSYTNWRNMIFCLKSISGGRLLNEVIAVSKKASRHTDYEEETRRLWNAAATKGQFGFASLSYWAKQCNPEGHHKCFRNNYNTLLFSGRVGHADVFATELTGSCVFDSDSKKFWLWVEHNQLWMECDDNNLKALFMRIMPGVVKKVAGEMGGEDDERTKALKALIREFQNNMADPTMACMRDCLNPKISHRMTDAFTLDANPDLLPLANGVWNFKENALEEYTRQHYISRRLPLAYDKGASQDDIKAAMRVWFKGNQKIIDFIQYWLGYVITGYNTRQDFLILFGSSAGNGKTTLIEEIIQKDILGSQFASTMGEDALTRVGGNNDDIYYAMDSRLAILSEAGGTHKTAKEINIECLKRLTGGGKVSAEAKFKGKKEGEFKAKMVMICNSMPGMPQDKGTRRRTNVVEMNVKMLYPTQWDELTDEEQASGDYGVRNPEFIRRLRQNAAGTLNWLLDGAKKFMANPEESPPAEVLRYTDTAMAQADEHRVWFKDGWEFDKVKHKKLPPIPFSDVAERWCEHFGVNPKNTSARGKFLKKVRDIIGDAYVIGNSNHGFQLMCLKQL